jgi:hypothetical protein
MFSEAVRAIHLQISEIYFSDNLARKPSRYTWFYPKVPEI